MLSEIHGVKRNKMKMKDYIKKPIKDSTSHLKSLKKKQGKRRPLKPTGLRTYRVDRFGRLVLGFEL